MDGEMSTNVLEKCLTALKSAKSDNDMFAALLMITKITKGSECDKEIKLRILDAINPKFFSRLLKTKVVPEGCPPNVYKDLALCVLSALCSDPELAVHEAVRRNIATLNEAALSESSESQKEGSSLADDCLAIFNVLSQSQEGQVLLYQERTVSTLAEIIQHQTYGHEKAYDILLHVLNECGPITWQNNKLAMNELLRHLAAEFHKDQTARKFELCKTLTFLLTTMPVHIIQEEDPPWLDNIVAGFEYMFRSRLDVVHRELSLRLAAVLVDVGGIRCVLPPHTRDCKTFLLMTHLCCVEVRMVLEEPDTQKAFLKGSLLSSCYSLLEAVINFMTNGPALRLDDRQVVQLHSAMVGAFGAVLFFLKKIAQESPSKWDSIVFATVRVLAAWLAEETSALREEVYSLLPFLIRIRDHSRHSSHSLSAKKGEVRDHQEDLIDFDHDTKAISLSLKPQLMTENGDQNLEINHGDVSDQETVGSDNVSVQELSGEKQEETAVKIVDFPPENFEQKFLPEETNSLNDNTELLYGRKPKSTDKESPVTVLASGDNSLSTCDIDSQQFKDSLQISGDDNPAESIEKLGNRTMPSIDKMDKKCSPIIKNCADSKPVPESNCLNSAQINLETGNIANQVLDNLGESNSTSVHSNLVGACGNSSTCDVKSENDEQGEILEENLPGVCAFKGFDILRFLLPGLCHLTTEDNPRVILIQQDLPELLEYYFKRQWNRYSQEMDNREIQAGLVILCNIFLNFTVLEVQIVKDCLTFHRILDAVVQITNSIDHVEGQLSLSAHLVALGLMMFRHQSNRFSDSDASSEHLDKFFQLAILFVRGAFVSQQRKKHVFVLCLTEDCGPVWNQISQTWFLAMQALAACFPLYPELYKILLKSAWIPSLLKMLTEVKGRDVDEETRGCFLSVLCAACQNPTCRHVIRDQGGLDVARLYGSKELMELLQKS